MTGKHGRDGYVVERRPRPTCRTGRDACDQLSFPKDTLHIFSILVFTAVSNPHKFNVFKDASSSVSRSGR